MDSDRSLIRRTADRLSGRWRADRTVLPDFIVIGAQKSGTSSLYRYLEQHPQVVGAQKKEVHFFDLNHWQGEAWYRSRLPNRSVLADRERAVGGPVITGEATPYYVFHPLAAGRMEALVPDAKLIALLRDPVDRALSHYHHAVRLGFEDLPFEEAIEQESARLDGEVERLLADPRAASSAHQEQSYLARGVYVDQLRRFDSYRSRGQLLIVKSEDLFGDPQGTYDRVLRFLDLAPAALTDPRARNTGDYARADSPVEQRLRSYFEPHNSALYEYLGRDLGW